jgi:putative colanic acid biosysnthesis UDP-glucose lipid carrier transferase
MPNNPSRAAFLHRSFEFIVILVSLFAAVLIYTPATMGPYYLIAGLVAVIAFTLAGEMTHLYASWRIYGFRQEIAELFGVFVFVGIVMVTLAFLTKTSEHYSRVAIASWWTGSFCLLALGRFVIRRLLRAQRSRGHNLRTLAIAGAGDVGRRVAERVLGADWLGLKLIGFYDDDDRTGSRPLPGKPYSIQGRLAAVVDLAKRGGVDYVYIALPVTSQHKAVDLIRQLSDTTASVFYVPDFFTFEMMQARWTEVGGLPVVSVFDTPFHGVDGWLKRIEDLALLLLLLIPSLPVMLLVAAGVKLTSPGPVLFKQRRYGLSGKVVEVWKFRTMKVMDDGERVPQARKFDPRITPFGALLRRTSLDELPQLINVLQGHMSIVGPRPHAVAHNEQYRKLINGYMLRHKVKPGITGWAQVNGWRGETDTVEKMQRRIDCDLYYIRNWSIWLDLKIVLLTALRGFTQPTAY